MKRRLITSILGFLAIVLAIVVSFAFVKKEEKKETVTKEKQLIGVEVIHAITKNETLVKSYTGKLQAKDRFEIYAQVDGAVLPSRKKFKEGVKYQRGEIMLQIDHEEARMNLLSQKSKFMSLLTGILPDIKTDFPESYNAWKNYLEAYEIEASLQELPKPATQKEKYFLTGRDIYNQFYSIRSTEERLEKYTIYAPYHGVVTKALVDPGKAVRMGTQIGELVNDYLFELELSVPLKELKNIEQGAKVKLSSTEVQGQWEGTIKRIGGEVDQSTQSVKIYIETKGKNLKEGMYLTGVVEGKSFDHVVVIPRKVLKEGKVYLVEDGKLKHQEVTVLVVTGEFAYIQGVDQGAQILKTVVKNAYTGMPVKVVNTKN